MKKLLFCVLGFIPFLTFSQTDTIAGLSLPMKNGKICYEKEYTVVNHLQKTILFERAVNWFKESFQGFNEPLRVADPATGKIEGYGIFKVVVSESGNYYWVKPLITVSVAEGSFRFQSGDYYEKPIEKGISNEYSKIEYRWRDFRKGKPWSAEDLPLFKGIQENSLALMAAFEKAMNQ